MLSSTFIRLILTLVLTVSLSACAGIPLDSSAPPTALPDTERFGAPFTSTSGSEDGLQTEFSGFREGHEPGHPSIFQLNLQNGGDQSWPARYCLFLLPVETDGPDSDSSESESAESDGTGEKVQSEATTDPVALAEEDLTIFSGGSVSRGVTVNFPENLTAGHYGLALIISRPAGPTVQVSYVEMNATGDAAADTPSPRAESQLVPQEALERAQAHCLQQGHELK